MRKLIKERMQYLKAMHEQHKKYNLRWSETGFMQHYGDNIDDLHITHKIPRTITTDYKIFLRESIDIAMQFYQNYWQTLLDRMHTITDTTHTGGKNEFIRNAFLLLHDCKYDTDLDELIAITPSDIEQCQEWRKTNDMPNNELHDDSNRLPIQESFLTDINYLSLERALIYNDFPYVLALIKFQQEKTTSFPISLLAVLAGLSYSEGAITRASQKHEPCTGDNLDCYLKHAQRAYAEIFYNHHLIFQYMIRYTDIIHALFEESPAVDSDNIHNELPLVKMLRYSRDAEYKTSFVIHYMIIHCNVLHHLISFYGNNQSRATKNHIENELSYLFAGLLLYQQMLIRKYAKIKEKATHDVNLRQDLINISEQISLITAALRRTAEVIPKDLLCRVLHNNIDMDVFAFIDDEECKAYSSLCRQQVTQPLVNFLFKNDYIGIQSAVSLGIKTLTDIVNWQDLLAEQFISIIPYLYQAATRANYNDKDIHELTLLILQYDITNIGNHYKPYPANKSIKIMIYIAEQLCLLTKQGMNDIPLYQAIREGCTALLSNNHTGHKHICAAEFILRLALTQNVEDETIPKGRNTLVFIHDDHKLDVLHNILQSLPPEILHGNDLKRSILREILTKQEVKTNLINSILEVVSCYTKETAEDEAIYNQNRIFYDKTTRAIKAGDIRGIKGIIAREPLSFKALCNSKSFILEAPDIKTMALLIDKAVTFASKIEEDRNGPIPSTTKITLLTGLSNNVCGNIWQKLTSLLIDNNATKTLDESDTKLLTAVFAAGRNMIAHPIFLYNAKAPDIPPPIEMIVECDAKNYKSIIFDTIAEQHNEELTLFLQANHPRWIMQACKQCNIRLVMQVSNFITQNLTHKNIDTANLVHDIEHELLHQIKLQKQSALIKQLPARLQKDLAKIQGTQTMADRIQQLPTKGPIRKFILQYIIRPLRIIRNKVRYFCKTLQQRILRFLSYKYPGPNHKATQQNKASDILFAKRQSTVKTSWHAYLKQPNQDSTPCLSIADSPSISIHQLVQIPINHLIYLSPDQLENITINDLLTLNINQIKQLIEIMTQPTSSHTTPTDLINKLQHAASLMANSSIHKNAKSSEVAILELSSDDLSRLSVDELSKLAPDILQKLLIKPHVTDETWHKIYRALQTLDPDQYINLNYLMPFKLHRLHLLDDNDPNLQSLIPSPQTSQHPSLAELWPSTLQTTIKNIPDNNLHQSTASKTLNTPSLQA